MLASSFVVAAAFSATAAAAMKLEYHNLAKRAPTYITNSTGSESNYTYIGCYSDAVANRVLTHDITNAAPGGYANMTILNCANAANASGYLFFGAEYGGECWAGDKIAASSQIRSNSSCNMACRGNDTEWCGAGDFLQMYQLTSNITKIVYFEPPAPTTKTTPVPATTTAATTNNVPATTAAADKWTALGCYQDLNNGARVFTQAVADQVPGGSDAMTNAACQATCKRLGFKFAGTEYYGECHCSNAFNGDNEIKPTVDCNTPCKGNPSEMCGGPYRVTAWGLGDARGPAPIPDVATTTTAANTATTPTATSKMGWKYLGCYSDLADNVRTFNHDLTGLVVGGNANMTNVGCQAACMSQGYKYCGSEWSIECHGSNNIGGGNKLAAEADCNMDCSGRKGEKCGGSARLSAWEYGVLAAGDDTTTTAASTTTISTTAAATTVPSPSPRAKEWKALGCYSDGQGGRAFTNPQTEEVMGGFANMTNAGCTSTCEKLGFTMAGTEWSGECWCSLALHGTNGPVPLEDCNMGCKGNASEKCGSDFRLTAWELVAVEPSASTNSVVIETTSTSTLSSTTVVETTASTTTTETTASSTTTEVTVSSTTTETVATVTTATDSTSTASESATTTAPETTSTESSSATATSLTADDGGTILPAPTNSSTSDASTSTTTPSTTIASPTPTVVPEGWNALGCYFDQRGGRALSSDQTGQIPGGGANVTHENCQVACRKLNFVYSGTEYAQECWCGNTIRGQNTIAPLADCNMPCTGNKTTNCGAGDRLTMFGFGTANGTAGSEPIPVVPVPTQPGNLPANWTYAGCWIDNAQGRILLNQVPDSDNSTHANCINACATRGFSVAGAQYGAQCFCGNALYAGAARTDEDQCSMPCSGNSFEKCGAGNRMSVFSIGNVTAYAPPKAATSSGNWTYVGCWSDNPVGTRALKWQMPQSTNNSAETCLSHCVGFGYMTGGMQYGVECSCGDWDTVVSTGSTMRPEAECNMACPGNGTQLCGAASRFSMYNWTGDALYEFATPQGADRGEYSMMIGGVVIPLIATLGINDKVMFLEKHGTGPPNSTGAYELDISKVDNPAAAWRTLHGIKTDVFCAAGVTLPDKAGRQLNVGGWSADSLYGVRLFTPDGFDGAESVNDWEENYQQVALQRGRWYPSAMTMANGSVLVVGGQIGSNGAPEPTLEILPNPAGGRYLHMDWLQRTDPYNLYPFLYVLPSGGIFVAYYNEARILDPVTFATRVELPNAPGSILAPNSGRSYPLEGTAMMLPQYAPYTDPVTILLCGGAEQYDGRALDNCVSIQPEAANPTWTIERMPSPRVMTNMVALPDGTFLIMGGAHQGNAGFGLATSPNNQAVLYDPAKPLGSRMSIMGSTDIARMYHSETILLPDGSVMVTGSDPQDNVNPQEYRMERFSPPYMQKGLPKPSFTLAGGARPSWNYGGSYSFSVSMPSGGSPRVAIMGAVSATHGASMGQRTYFPSVSCGGDQCTVTAPPTAEICVPGWYQMYVLDGPTPSVSQWVRIGGDPADIGSWPKFPDTFKVPGRG